MVDEIRRGKGSVEKNTKNEKEVRGETWIRGDENSIRKRDEKNKQVNKYKESERKNLKL